MTFRATCLMALVVGCGSARESPAPSPGGDDDRPGAASASAPARGGEAIAGEPDEALLDAYVRALEIRADRLERDLAAWAQTDFDSRTEAAEALVELSPNGPVGQQRAREALAEVGITGEDVTHLLALDSPRVEERTRFFGARMSEIIASHTDGFDGLPATPRTQAPLPGWSRLDSFDALARQAEAAAAANQPVIVLVSADWESLGRRLARETLADDEVARRLARYRRLHLDVTSSDGTLARLGIDTIPRLLVFADPDALAAQLAEARTAPARAIPPKPLPGDVQPGQRFTVPAAQRPLAPTLDIDRFVDAAALLDALPPE